MHPAAHGLHLWPLYVRAFVSLRQGYRKESDGIRARLPAVHKARTRCPQRLCLHPRALPDTASCASPYDNDRGQGTCGPGGRHKGGVSCVGAAEARAQRRDGGSGTAASPEGNEGEGGALFRASLGATGGAAPPSALTNVLKATFLGVFCGGARRHGRGRSRRECSLLAPSPPIPPRSRPRGTGAFTGADISQKVGATGRPRASLPPCRTNKTLINSAQCMPSRKVATARTGTICPAILGDTDIFL